MPDLVAISSDGEPRWRHPLPLRPVTLGRVPNRSEWSCPWDDSISRLHATVTWERDRLRVQRDPGSRNPVFFHGEPLDDFIVSPGDSFVIGETRFTLEPGQPVADPTPNVELTCSPQQLRQLKFLDAGERIEVLAQLPELIRFSPSEEELQGRVLAVLLQGIPRAAAAAIVQVRPGDAATPPEVEVRAAATRDEKSAAVPLSRRLVLDAITVRLQSVLYRWDVQAASPDFTAQPATDWALCVPLPDAPSPHWGLYVSGRLAGAEATPGATAADDLLAGDLKFAELAADIFGSLRLVGDLQRRHSLLTRFLSRPVLAALAQEEADLDQVLRRRQADVTVLFCDIRGSCLIGEEGREDLHGLWDRISAALDVMSSNILNQDGVIGDFQGDAAMGFWGWPLDFPDRAERAARAALSIWRDFVRDARDGGTPLAGFACGIGLASGPAIAGKLGTYDQFKVDVFGPVVNLAARLESMTKQFGVPVLCDEPTAQRLAAAGGHSHWCRFRRVARVQPAGMRTALTVSELLPSEVEPGSLREADRRNYEAALDAFLAGRWRDAGNLLRRLPPADGPARYLKDFMERHQHNPPAGWDGVIVLKAK